MKKELLELAAKAAGIVIVKHPTGGFEHSDSGYLTIQTPGYRGLKGWNPLTDDGDALRLAATLLINVNQDGNIVEAYGASRGRDHFCTEQASPDRLAATRRAIVRAAAEIGKSK
jgi:hypothetical protein